MLEDCTSEGTCRLVRTLLGLEHSWGRAVGHLLSEVITMECNMKLLHRQSLLPSLILPSTLATEAYQLHGSERRTRSRRSGVGAILVRLLVNCLDEPTSNL